MTITIFIQNQINQIKANSVRVVSRKCKKFIWWSPHLILALTILIFARLIRKFFLIRFVYLSSDRMGHYSMNTELYLCEIEKDINRPKQKYMDIFYNGDYICNHYLAKMWKRKLKFFIYPYLGYAIKKICQLFSWREHIDVGGAGYLGARNVDDVLYDTKPHLNFTEEEEICGQELLLKMGITANDKFICFHIRDSAYLKTSYHKTTDHSDHDYRDTDIDNCLLAAYKLVELGYFIIRVGAVVNKPFNINHAKIIDYACNGMRSEFLDIYLAAKCYFTLTNGSGFGDLAHVFRRPILMLNYVPFGNMWTFAHEAISLSKHYFSKKLNRRLTYSEIIKINSCFALSINDYLKEEIEVQENSPQEILDACLEMVEYLDGKIDSEEEKSLQEKFWSVFPLDAKSKYTGFPLHGKIRGRYCLSFLKNNPWWFE